MESKLNRLHPLFKMKHLLKVIGIIFVSHFTEGCTTLKGTGAVASGTAVFVYNPVSTAGGVIYDVTGNSVTKVQVTYVSGSPLGPADVVPGITFTGNETNGIIAFTFSGVAATDKGTYTLSSSSEGQLQCMTLHILGTGTTPTVQLNSTTVNVEEDTSVTFTCSATSDADPATSFTYTWTYEGNSLASETSNTLTITSAKASDTGKYQCTATEDITGGRSSTSLEVKLTVIGTTTTTSTTTTPTTSTTFPPTTTAATTTTTTPTTTTTSTSTTPTTTTTSTTPAAASTSTATTSTTATATTESSVASTVPSTSQTTASTAPTITIGPTDSNKGLITMIIVVSVIGGILIIAIVFMVFLMVYWNDCLGLRSHGKHKHSKVYRPDKHHHHGHHKKYKARREPSDLNSYQMQNPLEGYAFYKGVRNPVFDEGAELSDSPAVYYRDTGDMVYAPQYGNPPPRYPYASNWEILD